LARAVNDKLCGLCGKIVGSKILAKSGDLGLGGFEQAGEEKFVLSGFEGI
jgi:hypothetical protein